MVKNRFTGSLIIFAIGAGLLVLGIYLVQELIFKFLKFAVGLFLIFISLPMMLGSLGWWKFRRRGRVVRMHRQ